MAEIEPLKKLERRLGRRFRRRELLERALTHRSYANEKGLHHNYERLEFLGDAVLGLVAAEWLFHNHPEVAEGELSKRKAHLVSRVTLARYAELIGLGEVLRLGVGEARSGGSRKASLLADALEAVLGAVFVDGGIQAVRKAITPLLEQGEELREGLGYGDAKTRLQELAQARGWPLPEYPLIAEEGPDHQKRFTVECRIASRRLARRTGRSKKIAEQRAAAAVLAEIEPAAEPAPAAG